MEADTMSLRKSAPQWSLAGDKQLLGMLEKIHQTIITKCQDANAKLDAMVDAIDNASVDLQNVNNKFMALSNSQFVESRVYDDDIDVVTENIAKQEEIKPPTPEEEAEKIKKALEKLELMHEPVEILDSDSSDDEDETSMILKPKDVYRHRPLPYIIGSFAWKSKWHAGLVREESDSDSSMSKHEDVEEYSESEPETLDVQPTNQRTISSSSSLQSENYKEPQVIQQKPADIAAEISRRLGGPPLKAPTPLTVPIEVPEPSRTVYRIEKPAPATIFSDEPPPLDAVESEYSDDDIFAELHKKPHQNRPSEYKTDIMQDLFGDALKGGVERREPNIPNSSLRENSPMFEDSVESKMEPPVKEVVTNIEVNSKKPVGGISLFGTNNGAESIGAAILKRNQRKVSTSEEENDIIEQQEPENDQKEKINQPDSKKIIEDLFVKPVKKVDKDVRVKQPNVKVVKKVSQPEQSIPKATDKIDLFSDNLFDDIDDIFTTNVVTKPKIDKNAKSIFDDDDLFSEIVDKPEKASKKDTKSIFDDDDDLFIENDNTPKATSTVVKTSTDKITKPSEEIKKVKSIFDDDSDDDLFSDIKVIKSEPKTQNLSRETNNASNTSSKSVNSQNSERANIKENNNTPLNYKDLDNNTLNVTNTDKINKSEQFQSPSLFDAEDDELFNTTKLNNESMKNSNIPNKLIPAEDENLRIVNENKIYEDIGDHFESKQSFNDPPTLETEVINKNKQNEIPDDISSKNNVFNHESDRVSSKLDIEEERQTINEDIFQGDMVEDEPKTNIFTDTSKTENPSKSERKSDDPFEDIFTDLPPAFEKPSEPKKSKNVNALFDDDSDDESLFFKKDDVVSDEKPDINFDGDRFRIFHDEPPDIDVDFSQKPLKVANEKSNVFNNDENSLEQNEDKPVEYVLPNNLDDINSISKDSIEKDETKVFEEPKNQTIDISKLLEDVKDNEHSDDNESLKNNVSQEHTDKKDLQVNDEIIDSSEEIETRKPVGKLRPMSFNINVNTLLPGASPKKSKLNEETDGQSTSTQSNEELNIHSPTKNLAMVKSVSFDGDPDSEILDNKLSKERAKIQVKRRPSTRRARLEAVRKSRIDLESDSTDNSSSFDEPRREKSAEIKRVKPEGANTEVDKDKSKKGLNIETKTKEADLINDIIPKVEQSVVKKADVKSKVVYILNDEDIFSTPANTNVNLQKPNQNVLSIVDDDDALFKTSSNISKPQSREETHKIEVKSDLKAKEIDKSVKITENKVKQSIFGDSDDDEELFGKKKVSKTNKTSIFDSDTDEDVKLFTNKKKMAKKEISKGPLFNDESDDDDELFGAKTKRGKT